METTQNTTQSDQLHVQTLPQELSYPAPNSSEIGHLWTSYQAETVSVCMLKQYVHEASDPEIRSLLQRTLDISSQRVQTMKNLFETIHHPIPMAFGEKDVTINAKALFNDSFKLAYTRLMHKLVLINNCQAFSISSRLDFRDYFKECIDTSQEIIQKATNVLIARGALIHSPYIEIPQNIEIVHNKNYAGTLFGDTRALNAIELSHIISLLETKMLIRLQTIAFSQIVRSDIIRNHFLKIIHIADKHIHKLESILDAEKLPKPTTIYYNVTDSVESPFSDRLMLAHSTATTAFVIAGYGLAIPNSPKLDLLSAYHNFAGELLNLAKDGSKLMIEKNWLERIPEAVNRDELLH
ncbi:DUF3231 family protein [Desulfosporosinus sp. PR]|uniref:DUF3231 family protein n=1 Tax=Candidatus Desulfosporosinus nitrosoreducens TaxID=3401928 RepID=UPI0027F72C58|nr:DUF3231 family protein [Desulfosporosinus sp. PR]MDQ7092502.1 DUF3231 family protein [Desulfosporosinus sp. PR]